MGKATALCKGRSSMSFNRCRNNQVDQGHTGKQLHPALESRIYYWLKTLNRQETRLTTNSGGFFTVHDCCGLTASSALAYKEKNMQKIVFFSSCFSYLHFNFMKIPEELPLFLFFIQIMQGSRHLSLCPLI